MYLKLIRRHSGKRYKVRRRRRSTKSSQAVNVGFTHLCNSQEKWHDPCHLWLQGTKQENKEKTLSDTQHQGVRCIRRPITLRHLHRSCDGFLRHTVVWKIKTILNHHSTLEKMAIPISTHGAHLCTGHLPSKNGVALPGYGKRHRVHGRPVNNWNRVVRKSHRTSWRSTYPPRVQADGSQP